MRLISKNNIKEDMSLYKRKYINNNITKLIK